MPNKTINRNSTPSTITLFGAPDMDPIILNTYKQLVQQHSCSADQILTKPDLRSKFLHACWEHLPDVPEEDLLNRLLYLRKNRCLPKSRTLGTTQLR